LFVCLIVFFFVFRRHFAVATPLFVVAVAVAVVVAVVVVVVVVVVFVVVSLTSIQAVPAVSQKSKSFKINGSGVILKGAQTVKLDVQMKDLPIIGDLNLHENACGPIEVSTLLPSPGYDMNFLKSVFPINT